MEPYKLFLLDGHMGHPGSILSAHYHFPCYLSVSFSPYKSLRSIIDSGASVTSIQFKINNIIIDAAFKSRNRVEKMCTLFLFFFLMLLLLKGRSFVKKKHILRKPCERLKVFPSLCCSLNKLNLFRHSGFANLWRLATLAISLVR